MSQFNRFSRQWLYLPAVLVLLVALFTTRLGSPQVNLKEKAQDQQLAGSVLSASLFQPVSFQSAAPSFAPQTRLGFTTGDQWEPAIATDRFGHVYVLYPQLKGTPGCSDCSNATMILLVSNDRGATWAAPRVIYPGGSTNEQWDAQIVVDPVDGKIVYAAWLQNRKSDTIVAKSTDFGASWSFVVANHINAGTDKPILAVRGQDIYVAYNHAQKIWVSASHDGGATFTSVEIKKTGKLGWALAGGGTVDPAGNVYISWAGYERSGGAKGPVNLFISKSADGGNSWTTTVIDVSGAPPDCSAFQCGWAYLGAQVALASDAAGTLYALWNAGAVNDDKGPERMYFARSSDAGATWSPKVQVSTAPAGSHHAFPAIVAGANEDVRISWMDTRAGSLWNTYYRSSSDGGATWSAEVDLSTVVSGFDYIKPDGFSFPYGDYYELDIDDKGNTHVIWGEGLNYNTPGSIWYAKGK
ncbi:glycoside hydrolase [candidate division KSB1 bacterium]|nr:glycoside hydrolase [candidate division KSB1 bacterium]